MFTIMALPGGEDTLLQLSELIGRGALDDEDALLWFAGLLEPTDQGEAAPNPDGSLVGRKRRPIMLYEPLVKLAECIVIVEAMEGIRRSVEPCQLGVATPDGVRIAVRIMRAWAADIAAAVAVGGDEALERDVVIVGTDLRNAYGRMFRSTGIVSAVKRAPRLVPMLCNRWKPGNARVWQQIGPGQWEAESSLRGGGQGPFLSQVIFALGL